jgi:hypothetical protein
LNATVRREMARRTRKSRISSAYNLGGEQAEADPLLEFAYYETGEIAALKSDLDPRCFVIARTGGGKSAALQCLEEALPDHVIRISPEDLSLPYVTDLNVFRYLSGLGVNLDIFFIALWKHVLLVELIRHRYKVDSPTAKQNFLAGLRERISRDPAKIAALEYLNDFGSKFWCEADERVREITDRFERSIDAAAAGEVGVAGVKLSLTAGKEEVVSTEVRSERQSRYQRVVDDFQLARLNKMIAVLDENMLDTSNHRTFVVIDDLDRDWVDDTVANDLVRCLFRTVLDLKRVRHLKVLVALRTNILEQLDFRGRSGTQAEKLRSLNMTLRWSKKSIGVLLDLRARAAAELFHAPSLGSLQDLLPNANKTRGHPLDFVLDRTLMRPRDAISYLNTAVTFAHDATRISWQNLHDAELPYSEGRLLALRGEWEKSYPDIDKVLNVFAGAKMPLTRAEFITRLHEVMLLPAAPDFQGVAWITELSMAYWISPPGEEAWSDTYGPLTAFLYHIGFIGVAKDRNSPLTYDYSDPAGVDRDPTPGSDWRVWVHPAFWKALGIESKARSPGD